MARKCGQNGFEIEGGAGQLEPPGGVLDGQQIQLGIEVGELPADENAMGAGTGEADQEGAMGRDTATDGAITGARDQGRPGESGGGQGKN